MFSTKDISLKYRQHHHEINRIIRYLIVGVWNTLFGLGLYSGLYFWLGERVHYLLLAIPTNILAITNAYICYKLFVFKTKGNILREYLKCYLIYGGSMLLGMAMLYLAVDWGGIHPVFANIAITALTVTVSYIGHKFYSFRKKKLQ